MISCIVKPLPKLSLTGWVEVASQSLGHLVRKLTKLTKLSPLSVSIDYVVTLNERNMAASVGEGRLCHFSYSFNHFISLSEGGLAFGSAKNNKYVSFITVEVQAIRKFVSLLRELAKNLQKQVSGNIPFYLSYLALTHMLAVRSSYLHLNILRRRYISGRR